jgi:alanyl-tRNA synthetase
MRAHTATHLLQKALKAVLGDHVHQAGSLVEPDRLRFDFTHYSALTAEELAKIDAMVQDASLEGYEVDIREMPIDEAKAMGAMALFSEKYGDTVRVVNMGNYSIELCGGTHLDNTAKVGPFCIESEGSVASGVRRIEAVTGKAYLQQMQQNRENLYAACAALKTKPQGLQDKLSEQFEQLVSFEKKIQLARGR